MTTQPRTPARRGRTLPVAAGAGAGLLAAGAALLGRKVLATLRAGRGHPLAHRVLDVSSSVLQRKYPLESMSTYLNG
uniref:hypothetical protein n=1 Tax=Desertihabitans aurantiacus TaxID=2282477 RepID=UPI0018E51A6D